ncbi:MAG: bifunctional demethylmenaquinone methyltransferase/2-methoxy-6-polyprenyl-1,4-benzoquinol methylase UbiE [Saprospiraceae bacterium]|nr:bifunctional demethylmenaquinone methyltransferase/2-methoxy-6-polyprenyl-1,4-benzoquinol methylase UbiE [Saprospiraceae bacterium]
MEEKIVKPYEKEGSKKEQVTTMFDKIAPKYDLLNRFLSLGIDRTWRVKAISKLNKGEHKVILDVATGTADMILEMHKQLDLKQVIGMDISSEMINYGQKKIDKAELKDIVTLEVGDSEAMRYSNDFFDAATVAFGVRNFGNLEKGLQEMHRVIKPGGKIVILEFSRPIYFPFKQLFNIYFKYILPFIGRKTSKDKKAYNYLYESVQAFPDYDNFANILERIGFRSVEWKPLSLGICTIYTGVK